MKDREGPGDGQNHQTPPPGLDHPGTPADTTSVAQVLESAEAMYWALRMLPCRCLFNVPYDDCKVKRVKTFVCSRCTSMRMYEMVMFPNQVAA